MNVVVKWRNPFLSALNNKIMLFFHERNVVPCLEIISKNEKTKSNVSKQNKTEKNHETTTAKISIEFSIDYKQRRVCTVGALCGWTIFNEKGQYDLQTSADLIASERELIENEYRPSCVFWQRR